METTKTNNETLMEGAKIAGKLMKDTSAVMMDIYDRQVNRTTKYYSDLFDSISGRNKNLEETRSFTDLLFSDEFAKGIWNPFSTARSSFSNPMIGSFDRTYKQMLNYNSDMLSVFNKMVKSNQFNWGSVSSQYIEAVENQIEATKSILSSLSAAYNKQLDLSFETNKNVFEELNEQFNSMLKQNQLFLNDLLQTSQIFKEGEEKKSKEHEHNGDKKHAHVKAVA